MDSDKVVEIAVDLKRFKPGLEGQGRTPLVVLTWEKEEHAPGQTSHFMISQVEGTASSYISLKQLLNNNLTVYNLAMQMYEECGLKLRRINYPPLDLVFNHESLSNLKSEKEKIFELLNSFLENSSKSKTKTVYKINIETERLGPCEQFSTGSPQKKKKKHQLMKEVQRWLQDADKRLDDQQQLIDSQLDDRDSRVDAMLEEILELSKHVLDNNNAIPSVEHAQQIPVTEDANDDETDHTSMSNEHRYEPKKCEQDSQEPNDTSFRDKTTIMHKTVDAQENEGNGPTLDSGEKTNKEGIGQSGTDIVSPDLPKLAPKVDKKAPVFVSSPRKPPMDPPDHLSQGKATEVSGCQLNVWDDEPFTDVDEEVPDDAEDFDDLYDDGASYLDSCYVSSPGKFRRRAGDQQTGMYYLQFKSGSKVYRLPVLATYTYTPATATATAPKSLTYPSSYDSPVTQTGPLNFKEEQETKEEWGAFQRRKEMIWNTPEGQENLRSWLLALIGESPFWSRLSASMEEALVQDTSSVPRAKEGLDTILCLDTSGSMGGPHLEKMKKILLEFIDGVETMAKTYDLHENIAIVTFGGRARVIQHLTNDYTRLRQCVYALTAGGPGPLLEGIVVSMACLQHSGLVSIDSKFKLPPRLVIMCDGFPTSEVPDTNTDSGYISMHASSFILGALTELNHRQLACAMPHPIVFVQIGYKPNIPCLEAIATACGGSIIGVDAFPDLSRFHRNNMIAAEVMMFLRNHGAMETIEKYDGQEFLSKFAPGITSAETAPVFEIMKERFVHLAYTNKEAIESFCNIHEEPELPPLGSRVVRGQDWNWTNQDSEGTGTVINHAPNQLMYVQWDNGVINIYRYGHKGKYDVVVVHDQPRVFYDEYPYIGCQVERGPQWRGIYGDQDGGQGNYGVIIRRDVQGRFLVRWNNGNIFDYRCYTFYKYDVILRDPLAVMLETTARAVSPVHDGPQETTPDGEQVRYEWQREDGKKGWETYSEVETMKLNKAYARNPLGTCLIRRNDTSFRVSFKQLEERSMDKSKVKVRRISCRQ